ncbi:winged helix-turn-helix transcriptional regulator [Chelatococcus sambhunathii]|nr:helix-turn-helix domain-containing protein [Chelatococcus sambhunathii]
MQEGSFSCYTYQMDTIGHRGASAAFLREDLGPCTCHRRIRSTLDVIANKWAVPVFVELVRAKGEPLRFTQLARAIPGITQKELTKQLREMEAAGLVLRKVYPVVPPKVEYTLTQLGWSLDPVLDALARWAATYGNVVADNQARFMERRKADGAAP